VDLPSFFALLTEAGQQALAAAVSLEPAEANYLADFQHLSRSFGLDLSQAALETAILRREAAAKFSTASHMYFTRPALEQATSEQVSVYRARRFAGFELLVDLGCSIGGDLFALARTAPALGIDLDPLRLAMARANLRALDLSSRAQLLRANLQRGLPLRRAQKAIGLFFDPARRRAGRRVHSVQAYSPPLSVIDAWLPDFPALGVKISPAVRLEQVQQYEAEIEFISLSGVLKEAVLWFGPLRSAQRRATILPGGYTLADSVQPQIDLSEPLGYLVEPDPSVLRAGQVAALAGRLQASQLDPDIAYLTTSRRQETPFARSWQVEDWMPFQLKRLRAYLRERNVGQVVVKKRGSPLEPEAVIRQLKLNGDQSRVIFLTHLRGRPIAVICFSDQLE
jgi:THUMP domain-like